MEKKEKKKEEIVDFVDVDSVFAVKPSKNMHINMKGE
jgi:hypothetical protein